MDTSAVVRKATTNKDKEEYRKTGQCFECGQQGHIACTCPNKRPHQNQNARMVTIKDSNELPLNENDGGLMPATLAALAMHLSVEEKETFAHSLQELGADAGFQNI
jgi:hypothetical protein